MAKPKETNELAITPTEEKNTQELIEAIKPKALSVRRQSQRILSETNVSRAWNKDFWFGRSFLAQTVSNKNDVFKGT